MRLTASILGLALEDVDKLFGDEGVVEAILNQKQVDEQVEEYTKV